ncbi:hypothetical protein L13192_12720, partial [Pyrenophora tritici-repentis]
MELATPIWNRITLITYLADPQVKAAQAVVFEHINFKTPKGPVVGETVSRVNIRAPVGEVVKAHIAVSNDAAMALEVAHEVTPEEIRRIVTVSAKETHRLKDINYEDPDAPEDHLVTHVNLAHSKLAEYYEKFNNAPVYYAATILHPHYKNHLAALWK